MSRTIKKYKPRTAPKTPRENKGIIYAPGNKKLIEIKPDAKTSN